MWKLSKRLEHVARQVEPCRAVADIGTDHGYLPIHLLNRGICRKVIACDLRQGPLSRAERNRDLWLLRGEMELRLSNGLAALVPEEVDRVVIAGMGGTLMKTILEEGRGVAKALRSLVLEPQSEVAALRGFLLEERYRIVEEDLVEEDGKFYPILRVEPGDGSPAEHWTPEELRYGKRLLESRHPVLYRYLCREERVLGEVAKKLQDSQSPRQQDRRREVEESLAILRRIQAFYDGKEIPNGTGTNPQEAGGGIPPAKGAGF